jgi:hypothetical protein
MTLREIQFYIKKYTKKKFLEQIQFISSTAIATHGDKKGIDKTIDDLKKAIKDLESR